MIITPSGAPAGPPPAGGPAAPPAPSDVSGLVRSVRIGRQGVYDVDQDLVAYGLSFTAPDLSAPDERATSQVITTTFGTFGLHQIADDKPVFITFTRAFLTGVLDVPVEPDNVVVEVSAGLEPDRELVLGLIELKSAGYRLCLSGYQGELNRAALLDLVDYVSIDVPGLPSMVLPGLAAQARSARATLMARQVQDGVEFERCRALGFDLFQGPFLQRMTVMEQRTLSVSQLLCVRLLHDLGDPDVPAAQVQRIVAADPGLSLRLLRAANSASTGVRHEITSLRQALVLIGPRMLRSWVVLTLLDGNTVRNSSNALWQVLARAHAVEALAGDDAELGFTVGLLSGAAKLLGSDPAEVAEHAGVGGGIRAALVEGQGPAGRALAAVVAQEDEDWDGVRATGLEPGDVSRVYLNSLAESLQLVHDYLET